MQMINFLHSNNFSNEAAKRCIDDFYTVRTHCPEFFLKRNPREINLKCVMYFPFEKKTPTGDKILMSRLIDYNPDMWHFSDQIKLFDMATMLVLNKEGPSNGVIFITDLTGVTFTHVAKMNLLQLKKFMFYLQDCMPLKIKGLHFINIGNVMDKILVLIKPFMKKELLEVLHTHPTMETIYKMIPKELFPKDFPGGLAPSVETQQRNYTKCMLDNAAYFHAEEEQIVNEKLRPGKPKNPGEIFGVEGTFKKLDID